MLKEPWCETCLISACVMFVFETLWLTPPTFSVYIWTCPKTPESTLVVLSKTQFWEQRWTEAGYGTLVVLGTRSISKALGSGAFQADLKQVGLFFTEKSPRKKRGFDKNIFTHGPFRVVPEWRNPQIVWFWPQRLYCLQRSGMIRFVVFQPWLVLFLPVCVWLEFRGEEWGASLPNSPDPSFNCSKIPPESMRCVCVRMCVCV